MININTPYTLSALNKHYANVFPKLKGRVNSASCPKYYKEFLIQNLDQIIKGKPNELLKVYESINKLQKGKRKGKFNSLCKKIFRYDLFALKKASYNAYQLADNLKISSCPYCNRQYTITIASSNVDNQITRPDFDHFFPISKYPMLALSFYNLIPSCKICNSTLKGSSELDLNNYLNPYVHDIINSFYFDYKLLDANANAGWNTKLEVFIKIDSGCPEKDRIKRTLDFFKIEEIYNAHRDIVASILNIRDSINGEYLEMLSKNTYKGLSTTPDELYRLAFNNYYYEKDFYIRPFSKLTKDILVKEKMLEFLNKI